MRLHALMTVSQLRQQLFDEIFHARQRVYAVRGPTPLDRVDIGTSAEVWIKREDQPPIYAYKWRGAYNRMATLDEATRALVESCALQLETMPRVLPWRRPVWAARRLFLCRAQRQ